MKYLCLIYDEEKKLAGMSKSEGDAFMGEYGAYTESVKASGHYLGGNPLQPVHTATTIRMLGDFDLAEEAMHDAFTAAVEQWPRDGVPANPRAWLVSTGRFKSITAMRKRARFDASLAEIAERLDAAARDSGGHDEE